MLSKLPDTEGNFDNGKNIKYIYFMIQSKSLLFLPMIQLQVGYY